MRNNPTYTSTFSCSDFALKVMQKGKILLDNESPAQMIERVVNELVKVEISYGTNSQKVRKFEEELGNALDSQEIIFSTPVLTNAGRGTNKPLSACVIPPISLREDLEKIRHMVNTYHQEAIGTGFNFDEASDPIAMLYFLNEVAVEGANSGNEERPVGNIAILSIDNPNIREFVRAKVNRSDIDWKFNISVNVTAEFMLALQKKTKYLLKDGDEFYAEEIFDLIAAANYICGDPGLIFMERVDRDNPLPKLGSYTSIAPCAEVGLSPGESCQFGYINLGRIASQNNKGIDTERLIKTVKTLVRSLDNALEVSIRRFTINMSSQVMKAKRKIGVGVCGLADLLARLNIGYDSEAGRKLSADVIALINYVSKETSYDLGKERGSFPAFSQSRYVNKPGFLEDKYEGNASSYITKTGWTELADKIRSRQALRNCSTISLPPTGRSGLIIDASLGIEPFFNLSKGNQARPAFVAETGRERICQSLLPSPDS